MELSNIEPQIIWKNFSKLNAVPRPSKKEEKVIAFIKEFGENLGLETTVDEVGNVIIKKPATAGMENRKSIVLQSHLDMVCQKNSDVNFDFETEGIKMEIDGDWVKAKGTTLGADNGLGVATIMSILESSDIPHPDLEALFTIDEETGMTGALGLKPGQLTGQILLNLDTEEDDEIDIGCAGGIDVTITQNYETEAANAIPREAVAIVSVRNAQEFILEVTDLKKEILDEFATIEAGLQINIENTTSSEKAIYETDSKKIILALKSLHNGVYRMSPDVKDLVESSNNVARVELKGGALKILNLSRSSVDSSKYSVAEQLKSVAELAGMNVEFSGSYPGWKPKPGSEIVQLMEKIYIEKFNEKPHVVACHAGLECGIIGANYPEMEMVSFGPTIRGAHSPDEKANIPSAQKFWAFTKDILANIPLK
jgi:dipeptidase D